MKYVYKLNLPPLEEVFLDSAFRMFFSEIPKYRFVSYKYFKPADLFKEEFLNINGNEFDLSTVYIKKDRAGEIHADTGKDASVKTWGINWVHGGTGMLEYWDFLPEEKKIQPTQTSGLLYQIYDIDTPATHSYDMEPGCAYLVNAAIPHIASGVGNRFAVTLRSTKMFHLSWEEVVGQMKNLIKE